MVTKTSKIVKRDAIIISMDSAVKRSLTFHNARYTKCLDDGDSKAFVVITEENIYGDEFQVEKLECIGHVMKRIGSRLRRLKEKMKGQLLYDGKRLSGKNR
ncbi:hypothetical protein AVEN_189032-1 [Araneus ventricosus]|uniref:Mutator-like transposase domain-containing protein n=1 Tax=Araneus ventricosus TaxID=182803 RepID=A0A4Y2MIA0_ARAVE|nr:hypothetical protein AVEN_189032-1 [Araneus ventricosus]